MALAISSTRGTSSASGSSENALQPAPSHDGLTNGQLPPFKLISEDLLVNIFSRLEEDPRHLARLSCVCRVFAHVVGNVCWKRQCVRIVPEIMPSPQTHLDQIPEPPGGWGALMKLLVCCPGLKHAGIGATYWDFGLEGETGPMEMYNTWPRYVPKRRISTENVQGLESGELTVPAARDACCSEKGSMDQIIGPTGDSPVQTYTLSVRDCSLQSYTISRRDSFAGSNSRTVTGSYRGVQKSAFTIENGDGNGNGQSSRKDSSAIMDEFFQGTGLNTKSVIDSYQVAENSEVMVENGNGKGNGQSSGNDSSSPTDVFVQWTGYSEKSASNGDSSVSPKCLTEGAGPNSKSVIGSYYRVLENSAVTSGNGNGNGSGQSFGRDSSAAMDEFVQGTGNGVKVASSGDLSVSTNGLTEGGVQEKSVALMEESSRSLVATDSAVGQGIPSGQSNAASAPEDKIAETSTMLSKTPVSVNQNFPPGCLYLGMSSVTGEMSGKVMSIGPSSTAVQVQCGSGRPPRGKPVKRVHWKEGELASKGDKAAGPKLGVSGEHFTDRDRGRSRKRKDRALSRVSAKIPVDPKQRLHIVPSKWTIPREEGSRLLASRFRCDNLYICDWPGCVHPGEKRNYKLFRGFFKNFKTSLLWRNLKDMNAKKTSIACAFCSATSTWDMMTAFCLRRSFEYHDDGEPVVHACVCENGHVSGAWTDRAGVFAVH